MLNSHPPRGTRSFLNAAIIFSFLVLVGFAMAKAIQIRSIMGILLSLISLSAAVYFLYLLTKMKQEQEETA
jgi:hypothetical protein